MLRRRKLNNERGVTGAYLPILLYDPFGLDYLMTVLIEQL
jgi:hypothetical protein